MRFRVASRAELQIYSKCEWQIRVNLRSADRLKLKKEKKRKVEHAATQSAQIAHHTCDKRLFNPTQPISSNYSWIVSQWVEKDQEQADEWRDTENVYCHFLRALRRYLTKPYWHAQKYMMLSYRIQHKWCMVIKIWHIFFF